MKQTNIHGIPNVLRRDNSVTNLLWIGFLVLSTILCNFLILKTISTYLKHETTTSLDIQDFDSMAFPQIAFCNDNLQLRHNLDTSGLELTDLNSYYLNFSQQDKNELDRTSFLNRTVISCLFDNKPCNESDFKQWYNIYRGNGACLSYMPTKNTTLTGKFWGAGLHIELYLGESMDNFPLSNYGMNVIIFDNLETKLNVGTGFETDIVLSKTRNIKLPKPFNDCFRLYSRDDFDSESYRGAWNDSGNSRYLKK